MHTISRAKQFYPELVSRCTRRHRQRADGKVPSGSNKGDVERKRAADKAEVVARRRGEVGKGKKREGDIREHEMSQRERGVFM